MTISLHRLTRTFMELLSCRVRSSFPEQGVTSYSSYTLQRCVTLPMRGQLLVAQPGVLSRPQFHDVGPSSYSKMFTPSDLGYDPIIPLTHDIFMDHSPSGPVNLLEPSRISPIKTSKSFPN